MTHIAMLDVDEEGSPATWGDHVSDEEYAGADELRVARDGGELEPMPGHI